MKPRLIILSDLWGELKSNWIINYRMKLESNFEIKFYDCCKLGKVDISNYSEEALHTQFVNSGIETAVKELCKLEKGKIHILAFSIGGVIGWKFALANTNIESLVAVSSTRLRYETSKPNSKIELYFGEQDKYHPTEAWFTGMNLEMNLQPNSGHEVYKNELFVNQVCSTIKKSGNLHTAFRVNDFEK